MRKLRSIEDEHLSLKRLVADVTLDKRMLAKALRKGLRPVRRRELATWF